MHALRTVESIKISFEENFAISSCETDDFEASFAHLTSVDLSGEIAQLFQCISTLPSLMCLQTLHFMTWEYWNMDNFLQLLINLQQVIATDMDSCQFTSLEISNDTSSNYPHIIYNPIFVSPWVHDWATIPLAGIIGTTLSALQLDHYWHGISLTSWISFLLQKIFSTCQ